MRRSAWFAIVGAVAFGTTMPVSGPPDISAQAAEWSVDPTPAISVGDGVGEGHDLLFVRDAMVLPDGRLLVLSGGTHDLRLYSAAGRFIRSVGREGEGPGEFEIPIGFSRTTAGHVLVYDPGNLRVTEFDADFEVVGTQRVAFDLTAMGPAFGRVRPLEGGVVPVARYDVPFYEGVSREEGVYENDLVMTMLRGTDVVASVRRGRGAVYKARDGNVGITLPLPMGEFVLFNWGAGRTVIGSSHANRFDLFDETGSVVGTVDAEGAPRPATAADMAAYDAKVRNERRTAPVIRGIPTPSADRRVERFLDRAPRGDHVPMYDQVEIGDSGLVWVREYVLDQAEATWQVLDPETGAIVARLRAPAAWEMLRSGRDFVVVLEKDAFDVELLRVYAVRR